MEIYSSHSLVHPTSIAEVYGLPLPVRVEMIGEVVSPRASGPAMVFDLVNEGRITCYQRHPSPVTPLFAHEWVVVRARIETTPKGKLCVVEELFSHVPD